MSDGSNRLKELLDGKLSPQEIADDPMLASLAERIYGADFIEHIGISRGETKRALADQFTEIDGEDLLIEDIPQGALPLPDALPFDPPTNDVSGDSESKNRSKVPFALGTVGLLAGIANLFGALSVLGGSCTGGGCPSDGHTRLNWASIGNIDSGWGWSPSILDGSYGTPDIVLIVACGLLFVKGLLRK